MTIDDIAGDFRSRAGEFTGLKARVMFDLGDDGSLVVDATEAPPEISVEPGDADCTIRLSLDNLKKLMSGNLSPTLAYAMGKLKIEGSMGLAMKVAALLDDD
jgi:putative sterol carrier protein|tara:strand:+ start:78 stop:383 length:306 start_codon:yes stop_codon:yes gene_type:complete